MEGFVYGKTTANPPFAPSCDLILDVPADIFLCESGEINLCGIISTSYANLEYEWLEDGNSSNHDLCDNVSISEKTTFTLMATATSDDNIITNGDFANGDDGSFTTDYSPGQGNCFHGAGFLGCEGFYNILDNPNDGHNNFGSCSDFSGDGNMMVVNGAGSLQEIWCQDVCVDPEASYLFSSWATSVNPASPALLQFSIDGNLIGSLFGLNGSICDWEQFEAEWQANGETNVEICVTNQNTTATGNDFALDQIEFFQVCHESAEFEVDLADLEIDEDDPETITCMTPEVSVDIFIDTPFDVTSIEWDTDDGNITGLFNGDESISVDEAGTYTVTVTDEFGCTFEESIIVDEDIRIPDILLTPNGVLDCQSNEVEIEATSDGGDPEFIWEDADGNDLGDDDEITVTEPGTYFVTVTDDENGCTNTEDIEIDAMIVQPDFDLLSSNNLDCNQPSALLSTSVAYQSVTWSTATGIPIPETNDSLTVTAPGTYFATVNLAGCIQTDTVIVSEIIPVFGYTTNQETPLIDCINETADVSINFDPALLALTWQGSASNFGTQSTVELTAAGTYVFELRDNLGCTTLDSIILTENFELPVVTATATELSCTVNSASVTLSWPANAPMISDVIWTLPDGSSFTGGISTSVTLPGTVSYTAISSLNGCMSSGSIEVIATGAFPNIFVTVTDIDCNNPLATLSAFSNDAISSYEWTLPDGTLDTNADITSNQAGTYLLVSTADNGCVTRSEHTILEDFEAPNLAALDNVTLNCITTDTLISILPQNGEQYQWTHSTNGDLVQGSELLVSSIDTGSITLLATSTNNGCTSDVSFLVDVDILPPPVFLEGGQLNCDQPTLVPTIINDSGVLLSTIIWTLPSGDTFNGQDLVISEPGTYQAEIISAENGCSQFQEITVDEEMDFPVFDASATGLDCNQTSSTITVTSATPLQQIEYFNGTQSLGFGDELIVNSGEVVTVVVTDNNGCTATSEVTPAQDTLPPFFLASAPNLGCQIVGGVVADIFTSEVLSDIQLFDESGNLLGDISESITEAGTYTVTATGENGCSASDSFTIINDNSVVPFMIDPVTLTCNEPELTVPIITLLAYDSAILIDENGDIHSQADPPNQLIVSEEGTYTVIVTNTNGCTSEEVLEVELDNDLVDFEVSSTLLDCNNTTSDIILEVMQGYDSATILDPSDVPVTTIDGITQAAQLTAPGTYTMQVVGINGCSAFKEFTVDIDTITIDFDLEAGLLNCNNEPVEINLLNLTDPFTEAWYTTPTTSSQMMITGDFLVPELGIYEVTLVSSNGCENSNTIEVLQNPDIPDFSIFSSQTLTCEGMGILNDLAITGGSEPYQVFIDNVEETFSESIAVSGLGQHTLQLIDANGCILDTSFVLDPLPDLEAFHEPELMIIEGTELQLSLEVDRNIEDLTIEWLPQSGLSCFDCPDPFFIGTEDTEYTVSVIDQFGCATEVSVLILVDEIVSVYIPNVLSSNNGQNGNDAFTIYSGENDIEIIESLLIYDRWGNLVFEGFDLPHNDPGVGWDGRRAGQELEQGVYVYQARVRYSNQEIQDFVGDVTLLK